MPITHRLKDYFEHHVDRAPETIFSEFQGRRLSYAQAEDRANRLAHALIDAGCGKGDRFGLLCRNCDEMVIAYLAGAKSGAVPVPLNYRLAPREWAFILQDAQASLVIVRGQDLVAGMEEVRAELPGIRNWVAQDVASQDGWQDYEALLSEACSDRPMLDISSMDILYQMYTSGTTGLPKGAELSNDNVVGNVLQATISGEIRANVGDRTLIALPMYHAAAGMLAMSAMMLRISMVIHEEVNPAEIVRTLDEDAIDSVVLVPAVMQMCAAVDGVRERSFAQLQTIIYGASPIAPSTLRTCLEIFDCDIVQGYGMTELTATVTLLSASDHRRALAGEEHLLLSCGRPVIGTQLRVLDDEGRDQPTNTVGEIRVKGTQLMRGYWNRPEKNAEELIDGYLRTGDAARIDSEGYVYIEDRIKDMIVSAGENVYPREVEAALFKHDQILDAAVIGIPDEKFGESVMAFCVTKPGAELSGDELVAFCRQHIAGYKSPRRIEFVAELPRNPSGKVLKQDLRKPYWGDGQRRVN